jgi:hypothetical protein
VFLVFITSKVLFTNEINKTSPLFFLFFYELFRLGNAPFTIKQTTGNRFKQTDILLFGLYHPDTKGYMGDYRILAPRNKSGKLFERLNK